MKRLLIIITVAIFAFITACRAGVPERLLGVRETVVQIDSAVADMARWEREDPSYADRKAEVMDKVNSLSTEWPDGSAASTDDGFEAACGEAREAWDTFKALCLNDRYEEALGYYEGETDGKRNAGNFLVFFRHSTHRFTFFTGVLFPLMEEYRGREHAVSEIVELLKFEKAMEDLSTVLSEDGEYIPEVYPNLVWTLGFALVETGREEEAFELTRDVMRGVKGLTGDALYANAVGTSYVAELHSYLGMDEEAKGAWMQFREHVLEHADEYDGEELDKCLKMISKRIAKLEN